MYLARPGQDDRRKNHQHGEGRRGGSDAHRRRAIRHALGELVDHRQPRAVRPQRERHRARRTESRQRVDARLQRRRAQGDGRRSGRRSEPGAGHAEPSRASGSAGVHPRGRRAAADGELRPGRAREDGEDQHRHQREAGHRRRRIHSEERSDDLQCELEGPLRVLPRSRSRARADVPHGRRHRIGLGGHHRREGSGAHRREGHHRNGLEQGAAEPQGEGAGAGTVHRDPRAARQRAVSVVDDRHLRRRGRWTRRRWWWRRPRGRSRRRSRRRTAGTRRAGSRGASRRRTWRRWRWIPRGEESR